MGNGIINVLFGCLLLGGGVEISYLYVALTPETYYVNQTGFKVAGIKDIYHHIFLSILHIPFPVYELNNIHVFKILIINLVHCFKVLIFHIKLKVDKISKDHFVVFFVCFL